MGAAGTVGAAGAPVCAPACPQAVECQREPAYTEIMSATTNAALRQFRRLQVLDGTKELEGHPLFRSSIIRWGWGLWTQWFSEGGRWFLLLSALCFGYGTSSLELQAYIPVLYIGVLWLLALAAALLARPRVALRAQHAQRVCTGELLPVELEIEHRGWLAGGDWWVTPHRLPAAIDATAPQGTPVPPLERGRRARIGLDLRCRRRGSYTLRGFRVGTDFPFGLLQAWRTFAQPAPLLVYPAFTPLARVDLPIGRRYHPGGVSLASQRGESMEYIGNREFRDGDNVRDIDWRATARLNRAIVREYREEYLVRIGVVLDTHVPALNDETEAAFERAVSLCAAVADYMARQDYLVDILAAGPNLYHLTAGRSLAYLDQALDILACVNHCPTEPFEILEPEIVAHLAQITTIVCIFLDWTESRRAFVHRLMAQGTAVKVVVAREVACTIDPAEDAGVLGHIAVIDRAAYGGGVAEL